MFQEEEKFEIRILDYDLCHIQLAKAVLDVGVHIGREETYCKRPTLRVKPLATMIHIPLICKT